MNILEEELKHYKISTDDIQVIRDKEGVIVARVPFRDSTAVLKCFEREEFCREIDNYEILKGCGIPTIEVLGKSVRSILLEDIDKSSIYRLGEEDDLSNTNIIKALARWYKALHSSGADYVSQYGEGMYMEWDNFTLENIIAIQNSFNLCDSKGIKAIIGNYDELRKTMDETPKTLTYNDFYYTNMVVKKDESEALMFDYNLLGKGCYVSDIRNVTYWFSEENKSLFLSEYGDVNHELMLIDEIIAPIITLHSAMIRNIFPNWAKEAIGDLEKIPELISLLKSP